MKTGQAIASDREEALKALEILSKLDDDWNGYGARAPSRESIESAKSLISSLPPQCQIPTDIVPADGDVDLVWKNEESRLIITFDPSTIHYSFAKEGHPTIFRNNVPFDGIEIPQEVKEFLLNFVSG